MQARRVWATLERRRRPRGLDFLFSRNRLNVAISRAKCLAYLVASPGLLDANCRTVEQMRLGNALVGSWRSPTRLLECDYEWDLSEVGVARTHVVLSDEVLKAVDDVAGKRGRSRFLEEAAREKLERLELAAALDATAGIARGGPYEHWRDRRSAAAWVRKTRRTESPA